MTLGKSLCNLSAPQFPPLPISVCMGLKALLQKRPFTERMIIVFIF